MKTDLFQSCAHFWVFQICWHIECSTFTASFFRIWNSSTGIPLPPLALFVVMLSKAHLTSHSRMSGSKYIYLQKIMVKFVYVLYIYIYIILICRFSLASFVNFLSFYLFPFKNGDDTLSVLDNLTGFNLSSFMPYAFHHISWIMVYLKAKIFWMFIYVDVTSIPLILLY